MKSLKDKIFIAVILVVVAIGAIMLFNTGLEHIEDTNGTVSLVIAGESADFSMKMPTFEYNYFSHR